MRGRGNGGVRGVLNAPTIGSAEGSWTAQEHCHWKGAALWPSASGWSPLDLGAALETWYDFSLGAGIAWSPSSGAITTLLDQSGNNHDNVAFFGAPLATTFGGLDAIDNNTAAYNTVSAASGPDFTLIVLANIPSTNNALFSIAAGSSFNFQPSAGLFMAIVRDTSTYDVTYHPDGESVVGAMSLIVWRKSGGDAQLRTKGEQRASATGTPNFTASGTHTYLYSTPGTFCEYILVAGAMSVADVEKAEGYLAHKWGVTAQLPVVHPYKSTPP